jgi:hypothetical protein
MENSVKIVVLDYRPRGHVWRHDFSSSQAAHDFARPFRELERYAERGVYGAIKVSMYGSVDEMTEEYRNAPPLNHYGFL